MDINILGTNYKIIEDEELYRADGTCDKTTKEIRICKTLKDKSINPNAVGNLNLFINKVKRHELIHALAFESGLHECSFMNDEQVVDWIAVMYPKFKKIFKELDIED